MSDNHDRALMDEDMLIEMLHRVALGDAPPLRHGVDRVLAAGHRARRRRRAATMPASGLALVGAAALVYSAAHAQSNDRGVVVTPAASKPSVTATPSPDAQTRTNEQVLREALGDDFVFGSENEVTVRAGSPSAEGLPAGLSVSASLGALSPSPESGTLAQFCAPLVEKNVFFSACTPRILATGETVYVRLDRTGPGGARLGDGVHVAGDGVRVLFVQTDGLLVYADFGTQDLESDGTSERRDAARAWIDRMIPRLVNAVTDPRVGEPVGRHSQPISKPPDAGPAAQTRSAIP